MIASWIIIALLSGAAPSDKLHWKDVPAPEGAGHPLVARIFEVEPREATALASLVSALFEDDEVRAEALRNRLVVVGSPPAVEFLTAILTQLMDRERAPVEEEARESPPALPGPSKEIGRRLRETVGTAMAEEHVEFASFPAVQMKVSGIGVSGSQSIELKPVKLDRILGFIGRVKGGDPDAEVIGVQLARAGTKDGDALKGEEWSARIEFRAEAGAATAPAGLGFPKAYAEFRKVLDTSGVAFRISSMNFRLQRRTGRPEEMRLTATLEVPAGDDTVRLEKAFRREGSPFDVDLSSTSAGKGVKVQLTAKPKACIIPGQS